MTETALRTGLSSDHLSLNDIHLKEIYEDNTSVGRQSLRLSKVLIVTGGIVLAAGAIAAIVGGMGEVSYYQCVASGGSSCTSTTSNQYVTVFLANADILSTGMSVALMGVLILLGGIIVSYISKSTNEIRASKAS